MLKGFILRLSIQWVDNSEAKSTSQLKVKIALLARNTTKAFSTGGCTSVFCAPPHAFLRYQMGPSTYSHGIWCATFTWAPGQHARSSLCISGMAVPIQTGSQTLSVKWRRNQGGTGTEISFVLFILIGPHILSDFLLLLHSIVCLFSLLENHWNSDYLSSFFLICHISCITQKCFQESNF
jgi:hypothetical protein